MAAQENHTLPPAPLPDLERFVNDRLRAGSRVLYGETLTQVERQLILQVLGRTGGNQVQAANILGITRGSLRHKIRSLGIVIDRLVRLAERGERIPLRRR